MLIPIAGEFLAMSREQFEEARRRGREIIPPSSTGTAPTAPEEILDAEGMEKRTGIPASWWLENARRGSIPHLRAGKYVRFALTDAITFLKISGRPTITRSSGDRHTTPNSTPYAKRPRSATGSGSGVAARIKSVSE